GRDGAGSVAHPRRCRGRGRRAGHDRLVRPAPRVITLATVRRTLAAHRPTAADQPGSQLAAVALMLAPAGPDLEALFIRRAVRAGVRGVSRTFPAYVLGRDVIWGMTERILTSFITAVSEQR